MNNLDKLLAMLPKGESKKKVLIVYDTMWGSTEQA